MSMTQTWADLFACSDCGHDFIHHDYKGRCSSCEEGHGCNPYEDDLE